MASCKQMVEGNTVSFMCDLTEGHLGPHRAVENPRSVQDRAKWEADQQHAVSGLGEFQGRAETTAERYSEGALDHPAAALPERNLASLPPRDASDGQPIRQGSAPRPQVVIDYADQILSGEVHNPYDENCRKHAPVLGKDINNVERCYICRPEVTEVPIGPETDPSTYTDLADLGRVDVPEAEPRGWVVVPSLDPTKQREGDQVLPSQTGDEYVQDRILAKSKVLLDAGSMTPEEYAVIERTMIESKRVGTERYGTPLQTFNGRDALQDLVEELRDAFVYGNQLLMAREADSERLVPVVHKAILEAYMARIDANIQATPEEHSLVFAESAVAAILKGMGPLP